MKKILVVVLFCICGMFSFSPNYADARRVKESGTFRIIENYLTQNSAEIEIYYGRGLDEETVDRIIQIGSWLNQNTRDLTEFALAELCGEIKKDSGIEVTPEELRYIIGIVMGIKDTRDPTGKTYLLPLMSEILNSDGSLSGRLALRIEKIHKEGLLHGTSNVAIFKLWQDKVYILIQERAKSKFLFPGRDTLSACGHIEPGMDSLGAAIKETTEEVSYGGFMLNAELVRKNLVRVGQVLQYEGFVKQHSFEYPGDDFDRKFDEIISMLKQDGYLSQSIFFDSVQDENGRKWIVFYTMDSGQEARLDEIKSRLEEDSSLQYDASPSRSPYNRERKSFYLYVLKEGDHNMAIIEDIIRSQSGVMGGGEVGGFRWVEFGELLKEFQENPSKYTDAFFPFFSEASVLGEIIRELEQHAGVHIDTIPSIP